MSNSILVGPLLGFENGEYYSVCVLLPAGSRPPVLNVSALRKQVKFSKMAVVGENDFWRAEFKLPVPAVGTAVSYDIKIGAAALTDPHGRTKWQFHLPGKTEQPRIAYGSCNGFSSAKLARDTDNPYLLWQKMAQQHEANPYSLLLLGGDQVYADDIWESRRCPSLQAWSELNAKAQEAAPVTPTMAKEIADFYNWLYLDRWKDPTMALMFASIPAVMMWDDHDIFDGWGSYPEQRQNCAVFQAVFQGASRTFDVFQLRCGTRNRLNAQAAHRSMTLKFHDYHILVLDNRSERTPEQIMAEEHWREVKAWLASLKSQRVSNLLVMTGVPAVYRSFAAVEKILDTTPWQEELEDDVHDHWSARAHQAERMRLVMVLLNFLELTAAPQCKALILSGDVHVGALGQIWNARTKMGLTQVIASGIVHPPPSAFAWAGIQLMTSDTPEALGDGDVTAEMLTPLSAPRYLRTRNFATLQLGTDQKIWINWICESDKLKPSFAVS